MEIASDEHPKGVRRPTGATPHLVRRWAGKWIWAPVPSDLGEADRKLLFRRAFDVEEVPSTVLLRVAGDSRYIAWVNGEEVLRGPVRGNPHRLHYDEAEVARLLRPGRNVVAILARYYGVASPAWRPVPRTLTLGGGSIAAEVELPGERLGSDEHWRVLEGSAWTPGLPTWQPFGGTDGKHTRPFFEEILDARALPPRWTQAEFDDSGWPQAREIVAVHPGGTNDARPPSDPYGPLLPRPVPQLGGDRLLPRATWTAPLTEAEPLASPVDEVRYQISRSDLCLTRTSVPVPLRIDPGHWAVVADFGEIVSGTIQLEVDAAPGTVLDLAFAEEVDSRGVPVVRQLGGIRYVARGQQDAFEAIEPSGGRYIVVSIQSKAQAVITCLAVQQRRRPRTGSARFACSDPRLERIYQIGLHTVDLIAQDAYISDLAREQRAWMDYVVPQMVDFVANDDWRLARWHPQLAASPRADGMLPPAVGGDLEHNNVGVIPDHALHWIRSVYNLYRYTGDRELVASLLPVAEGVLRWFGPYRGEDGLVHEVEGHVFIDWESVYTRGCSSALNALWGRALREFEEMALWLGDAGRAGWARDWRSQVAAGLTRFWDSERGGYVDHAVDGQLRRPLSVHATAAAACAEILPARWATAALDLLTDRSRLLRRSFMFSAANPAGVREILLFGQPEPDWNVDERVIDAGPFYRYVVHEAVARLGAPHLVADLCLDWQAFVDAGETTWPETWHGGTHCHGWSSTPTSDLVVYTAGIAPALPGYARVRVAPALGDLDWVEAVVPSPHGPIFARTDHDSITVDAPVEIELVEPRSNRTLVLGPGEHVVKSTADR